jgi:hypothetical protein
MNNADMPAMPQILEQSLHMPDGSVTRVIPVEFSDGITKREHFAAMAMQGLLSNSGGAVQANSMSGTGFCNTDEVGLAQWSLACADALLKELEK